LAPWCLLRQNVERETGGSTNKKKHDTRTLLNIVLDGLIQKGKFYQKICEANKVFKMFFEAYTIFNFTFYFPKSAEFRLASFAQRRPD
jgi:hypothetical protein